MASIITHQLRKAIAEAIYDDIFSRRNNYYYYFGRYLGSETVPTTPLLTREYESTVRNHILAAKKVYVSDVAFVVPRFDWVSGNSYVKYNNQLTGVVTYASGPKFYVYDDVNYRVYKCIDNNGGAASTVRPTSTDANDVTYADGYVWRYMYSLPKSIRNKFLTGTYLPVFNALQNRYYSDGGLGEITIVKAGNNYTQATTVITVTGDGSGAVLEPVIVNGQLGDVIVRNPGRDYTRTRITVTDPIGTGAEIIAELNVGDLDSDQALVELLTTPGTVDSVDILNGGAGYITAAVEVHGDGTGATAQAVIIGGVITKIIITNKGENYSYAELEITGQTINPPTEVVTAEDFRVNVSPFLGHGRNAVSELYADTLMVFSNIDSDRLSDFDVVTPYKQFGLIKNLRNLDYTSNIYDQVSPNRYQVEADFGPVVKFVGGGGTGAKGRVNVTGNYVSDIKIESVGAGYSSTPTISFTGTGTGATATAKIKAKLNATTLSYGGVGYASAPGIAISSTTGSGGSITAATSLGIGAIAITNQGTSYVTAPTITFGGGTGSGAAATAVISGGKVVKVIVTSPGNYTVAPTSVTFAAGPGVTATGTPVSTYTTSTLTVNRAGDNYESAPELVFNGASGVKNIVVNDPGELFTAGTGPALTFSGGGGNGLAATAYVDNCIRKINITNYGSGYTVAPNINIAGGGGTGATATAVVSAGKVVEIVITNRGSGYTSAPTITFTPVSGGSGAAATAIVSLGITHINVTNPGTGYTSTPNVVVSTVGHASRTGFSLTTELGKATGSVSIQGPLKSVTLTGNGSGYTSAPTVVLSGGSPTTEAVVYSKVIGEVSSITIDEGGSGYSSAPSVIIAGGEGLGASYVANFSTLTNSVTSCSKVKGGSNYVITKFADFTIGTLLIDEQLNEYRVHSAKTNKKDNSLIITSNNGTPVVGRMKIRKKNASDYFITNTALSQKFLESRFPVACYRVQGSFTLANFPPGTTVTLTDQVNGNKTFILISSQEYDTGANEMLLLPIDGGTINNGVTLTNGVNSFSVISYTEPALDRRTGELLMISNSSSSFTQNSDQTLSFRTIINF